MMDTVERYAVWVGLALVCLGEWLGGLWAWLMLPGWFVLAMCVAVWIGRRPYQKQAAAGAGLYVMFTYWAIPADKWARELGAPSMDHFKAALWHPYTLSVAVIYLAGLALVLSSRVDELEERSKRPVVAVGEPEV